MGSFCRSVVRAAGSRSMAGRSRPLAHETLNPMPASSSSSRGLPSVRRSLGTSFLSLATVESLMPLHSAVASARLKSRIALDSHCWSCLSQGFATPL